MGETVTPGQVLHDSLRASATATFGLLVSDFATWEQVPQWQRERMENAGQDVIAPFAERLSALARSLRAEAKTIGDVVRAEERHDAANRIDEALHAVFDADEPGGGGD